MCEGTISLNVELSVNHKGDLVILGTLLKGVSEERRTVSSVISDYVLQCVL